MMMNDPEQNIQELFRSIPRKSFDLSQKNAIWLRISNRILQAKLEAQEAPRFAGIFWDFIFLRKNLSRALAVIILVLLATTILRGAADATPGKFFYPVKKAAEQVEKVLATNDEAKANVGIKHARRRLQEVQILVAENGQPEVVNQTLQALKSTTQEVVSVSGSKPDLVSNAVNLVTEENQVLNDVKDQVQSGSQQTLQDVLTASTESITKLTGGQDTKSDQVQGATASQTATSTVTTAKPAEHPATSAAKPKPVQEGVLQSEIQIDSVIHSDGTPVQNPGTQP